MAVQAGINNVNRELSEVYAGVSGVNRKLDKWQCCIGNVNRNLLDMEYTMQASDISGTLISITGSESTFTPSVSWDEIYTGIRIGNLPSARTTIAQMNLTFSENLAGKTIIMTVERLTSYSYTMDVQFGPYISGVGMLATVSLANGVQSGTSDPFQFRGLINQPLSLSASNSTSTDVIVGFYVDSTPIKLI